MSLMVDRSEESSYILQGKGRGGKRESKRESKRVKINEKRSKWWLVAALNAAVLAHHPEPESRREESKGQSKPTTSGIAVDLNSCRREIVTYLGLLLVVGHQGTNVIQEVAEAGCHPSRPKHQAAVLVFIHHGGHTPLLLHSHTTLYTLTRGRPLPFYTSSRRGHVFKRCVMSGGSGLLRRALPIRGAFTQSPIPPFI